MIFDQLTEFAVPRFAVVDVLLLSGPAVLEPDLGHSFGQSRDLSYPLQVLAVGIGIYLKIRLKNLNLFLGEGRPHPLRFLLRVRLGVSALCRNIKQNVLQKNTKPFSAKFLPSEDV